MDGKLCGGAEYAKARASLSHSIGESQVGAGNLRGETDRARKWGEEGGRRNGSGAKGFGVGVRDFISWR